MPPTTTEVQMCAGGDPENHSKVSEASTVADRSPQGFRGAVPEPRGVEVPSEGFAVSVESGGAAVDGVGGELAAGPSTGIAKLC